MWHFFLASFWYLVDSVVSLESHLPAWLVPVVDEGMLDHTYLEVERPGCRPRAPARLDARVESHRTRGSVVLV